VLDKSRFRRGLNLDFRLKQSNFTWTRIECRGRAIFTRSTPTFLCKTTPFEVGVPDRFFDFLLSDFFFSFFFSGSATRGLCKVWPTSSDHPTKIYRVKFFIFKFESLFELYHLEKCQHFLSPSTDRSRLPNHRSESLLICRWHSPQCLHTQYADPLHQSPQASCQPETRKNIALNEKSITFYIPIFTKNDRKVHFNTHFKAMFGIRSRNKQVRRCPRRPRLFQVIWPKEFLFVSRRGT